MLIQLRSYLFPCKHIIFKLNIHRHTLLELQMFVDRDFRPSQIILFSSPISKTFCYKLKIGFILHVLLGKTHPFFKEGFFLTLKFPKTFMLNLTFGIIPKIVNPTIFGSFMRVNLLKFFIPTILPSS